MYGYNHWLIQTTGRIRPGDEQNIVDGLKAIGVPFFGLGVIPFTNQITGAEDIPDKPGFLHCSTKMVHILSSNVPATKVFPDMKPAEAERKLAILKASLIYDRRRFDQSFYRNLPTFRAQKLLLNHDAAYVKIGRVKHHEMLDDTFMKPAEDLKLFKGCIVERGRTLWQQVNDDGLLDSRMFDATEDIVVMATLKDIRREWRFFVVEDQIVAASQYMYKGHVTVSAMIPESVYERAIELAAIYRPSPAFVMDLCELESGEIKIVEYNCINASGVYKSNIIRLAESMR